MLIAGPVGRREDVLGEPGPLLEDALEQVAAQVVAAKSLVVVDEVQHFVDDETDISERSAVRIHGVTFLFVAFAPDFTRGEAREP